MSANVSESDHAQCELRRILKTVRMKEQSGNNKGNHPLLFEMVWLLSHSQHF